MACMRQEGYNGRKQRLHTCAHMRGGAQLGVQHAGNERLLRQRQRTSRVKVVDLHVVGVQTIGCHVGGALHQQRAHMCQVSGTRGAAGAQHRGVQRERGASGGGIHRLVHAF